MSYRLRILGSLVVAQLAFALSPASAAPAAASVCTGTHPRGLVLAGGLGSAVLFPAVAPDYDLRIDCFNGGSIWAQDELIGNCEDADGGWFFIAGNQLVFKSGGSYTMVLRRGSCLNGTATEWDLVGGNA